MKGRNNENHIPDNYKRGRKEPTQTLVGRGKDSLQGTDGKDTYPSLETIIKRRY